MKRMATAQQKGGVGKTAGLIHIAHAGFERGLRVAVIDLDTQGNASDTLAAYASGVTTSALFRGLGELERSSLTLVGKPEPRLTLISADPGLADLEDMDVNDVADQFNSAVDWLAEEGYDLCLIDTPPSLGKALTLALYVSEFVISPIQLKVYSLNGIEKMNLVIGNMRQYNPGLKFLGMVPSMLDRRKKRQVDNLEKLKANFPQLILPEIGLRDSIDEAVEEGVPVWRIKKTAARAATKELRALAESVFEKMGIK
jgi:chromosome partitioning protein